MPEEEYEDEHRANITAEEYREYHINKMTALIFWFLLICVLAVVGAFVVKLVIWIV